MRPSIQALYEHEKLKGMGLHESAAVAYARFERLAEHEERESALLKAEMEARLDRGEPKVDGWKEWDLFDRYACRGCRYCSRVAMN